MVVPGDAARLGSIVGSRRNLHHSGSTNGSCLMEVPKSNLKDVPLVPTAEKHAMLAGARVSDESRVSGGRGFMASNVNDFKFKVNVKLHSVSVTSVQFMYHHLNLHCHVVRPRCSWLGSHGLEHSAHEGVGGSDSPFQTESHRVGNCIVHFDAHPHSREPDTMCGDLFFEKQLVKFSTNRLFGSMSIAKIVSNLVCN